MRAHSPAIVNSQHRIAFLGCRSRALAQLGYAPHMGRVMNLDLTDEEAAALVRLIRDTIDADRYPLSPRLQILREVLEKLDPRPVREPLPPPRVYAPSRATAAKRRRG